MARGSGFGRPAAKVRGRGVLAGGNDAAADFAGPAEQAEQLVAIAKECGYADAAGQLGTYKKPDLVNALVRYFQSAKAEGEPTAQQQKARDWLPEAMLFPAVDPNMSSEITVDEETDGPDSE